MTDLTDQIARLSPEQRARLAALLRRPVHAAIVPVPRQGDAVPLSFTQERIWFLEQFNPGTAFRNMSGVARIPVPVDAAMFTECVEAVVDRHEILRTRFDLRDCEPAGTVMAKVAVPVRVLDELPERERELAFQQDAIRPFDLRTAPLLRVTIAPDGAATFVQLTMHHIASDGFSTGVFFQELGELYRQRLAGLRAGLPRLPFQFADVAAWERDQAGGRGQADSIEYWTGQLRDAPGQLNLPGDFPRPARMTYRGKRLPVEFSPSLVGQVRLLSQRNGVTPFVTALTAFAVTLSRYSAQDDLVIGIPVANREQSGVEQLIGPFLNTLALRLDLSGDPTFATLSQRVNRVFLTGLDHQDVPFERVLQAVQGGRDPGRSPLFQVVFNYQADQSAGGTPGSELRDLHNGGCDFDLLCDIVSTADTMTAHIDYYADVYREATIAGLAAAFQTVLGAAAASPDVAVTRLPLLPPRSAERLAARTAGPARKYDQECLVHDLVLRQARKHPARIALIYGTETISYGELDARSAAVAAALREQTGRERTGPVAICLPRSAGMIIAILGVLRAGFSYVPLDPEYPRDRLAYICQDADIAAMVTEAGRDEIAGIAGVPVILIDGLPADPGSSSDADPGPASQCAYTIYTSGSTGLPKGVQVSHRNVVNFLHAMRERPGMNHDDVLLAVTSPSFDIAVLEMLLPLFAGARAVVAQPGEVADGRRLARLLDEHQVTIMQGTPATWQLMLDGGWRGQPGLRALCGGEAFPPALAGALLDRCGEVWNMYGPTETTIWSTLHQVTAEDVTAGVIPIGTPIANTTALVLDAGFNPVPPGVLGELCIGGHGVSIGYYQRPELTADRFVVPATLPGRRMYRTGDLARSRPDGTIEFAGRNDRQVKVRGFRVELGEIEAVLGAHPGVSQAVAAVTGGRTGDPTITGYVTVADQPGAQPAELLAFAGRRLPEYMLPSRIAILTEMPLTPNGKIDRNNLPGPDTLPGSGRPDQEHRRVAPRDDTERALAAIWQDLLDLPEVGVHDSFFELGGHSLLATKLIFRIHDLLGADLPLTALFDGEQTIAHLATLITQGAAVESAQDVFLDLAAEARLAADIRPAPLAHVHSVRHPQHVFLTGATGFVGAFLLRELLATTEASVFCLVRAASAADGLERIREAMTEYGIWDATRCDRVIPVLGTLDRARLGLSKPQWQHLAAMTDVIYHCGAEVNFLRKYGALKAANVLGTQEVLRLARDGSVKPVHFVSTIYVFSRFSYPPGTEFYEDMTPIHDLNYTFGYTQSKWVSEQLVMAAGRRGIPVYVYRLGRVAGHSKTGACQTYDFVWQVTKVGIEMAAAPVMDMTLDVTPVDYVASALVHLSRQPDLAGRAFHLLSPRQVTEAEFVTWLEHYGYRGERLTFSDWCQRVVRRAAELSDRTAGALAPFLSGTLPLDRMPAAHFDQANVDRGLAGSTITCPPMTEELLGTYLDYFRDCGYLPPPASADTAQVVGEGQS